MLRRRLCCRQAGKPHLQTAAPIPASAGTSCHLASAAVEVMPQTTGDDWEGGVIAPEVCAQSRTDQPHESRFEETGSLQLLSPFGSRMRQLPRSCCPQVNFLQLKFSRPPPPSSGAVASCLLGHTNRCWEQASAGLQAQLKKAQCTRIVAPTRARCSREAFRWSLCLCDGQARTMNALNPEP